MRSHKMRTNKNVVVEIP